MRGIVRGGLVALAAALLCLATTGSGCEPSCADSCSADSDCGRDLVCYASQCAPKECRESCSSEGLNVCLFNRVTCTYLGCQ